MWLESTLPAGKTRTILNLLSVIMHAAQKDALQALKVWFTVHASDKPVTSRVL